MRLRKIYVLVNTILIGLLLWVGVTIYRTWATDRSWNRESSQPREEKSIGKQKARIEKPTTLATFQSVMKKDIFKTHLSAEDSPKRKAPPPVVIKETNLDLELRGTMIDDKGVHFAVILDGKTREQQAYREKDLINGSRIEEIHADRVILERKGKREALIMSYESRAVPKRVPPVKRTPRARVVQGRKKNALVKRRLPLKQNRPEKEEGGSEE
jgi:type II secretory pathway component PulC